jgi:hypothetical protein
MFTTFVKKLLALVIGVMLTVILTTTLMSFVGVPPTLYNPYLFFGIAMAVLAVFLSPTPLSDLLN